MLSKKENIQRLACCQYSTVEARNPAEDLISGKWTHDYPIAVDEDFNFL